VTDLEWGWTYRTTLEALKQQHAAGVLHTAPGERSIDIVARKYGVNRKTVQRKIRLTYLIPQLYRLGMEQKFSQKMLVNLSYLPPVVQTNVVQAAVIENVVLTDHLTAALRTAASQRDLTINDVLRICHDHGNTEDPADRRRPVKYEVPDALFPKTLRKKQRQNYITAALTYIRDHEITLDLS
jgi:ParB family chromosome partitioning protein